MRTWVALFRGINVGGRHLLPMKRLRGILQELGLHDVRTYIQSGNVVFRSGRGTAPTLARQISAAIEEEQGFRPHVILLRLADLEEALRRNPFPEAEGEPRSLHLGFLAGAPRDPDLQALERVRKESERFHLDDLVFYLHAPDGIGRSKLGATAERALGVPMTLRRWRTILKVRSMAGEE
jgi:uncharacterized protein (DUF1697 family)